MLTLAAVLAAACTAGQGGNGASGSPTPTPSPTATMTATPTATATATPTPNPALHVVVSTFNVGAGSSPIGPNNGYDSTLASAEAQYYGHGLAWPPAIEATRQFFADVAPDIVNLEEIFYAPDCAGIPSSAWPGLYCETWTAGDPTVIQVVMGAGYQIACNLGHSDNCMAVKKSFGSIRGCSSDFCLEGLAGSHIDTCGNGARVGRGVIDMVEGGSLTAVEIHATSGEQSADMACRTKQVEQIFVDLGMGDASPAANGAANVVMGDFNTDPGRLTGFDPSAARIDDFVGDGKPFHFVTDVGPNATPTYSHLVNIDLVISDALAGTCWAAGVTDGHPAVTSTVYFDHNAIVCTLDGMRPAN